MTNDAYFKSLSPAEWDHAQAIEAEINGLLKKGLTERVAIKFVRTVLTVRKDMPSATVEGIFDAAILAGLPYIEHVAKTEKSSIGIGTARPKPAKQKQSVRGI